MGYIVTLYEFNKRQNSTRRPDKSLPYIEFNALLNNGSGLLSPSFTFDFSQYADIQPQDYNYAYIAEFNRYYFITDWRYNMGLWTCEMSVDVLASWRGSIGALSTYILRSASNFDRYLPDKMYPIKSGAITLTETEANPFNTSFANGYFVVGLINSDSGAYGAVSYYVFTSAQFRVFCNYLLSNTGIYNVSDISTELLKVLYNPFQYVVSCMWLPFQPPTGATLTSIPIGWWTIPASAARLSGQVRQDGYCSCPIPRNPVASGRSFMFGEPYTEYYLDFPPFGSFTISADNALLANTIEFKWTCDCITGMGRLEMGVNAQEPYNIVHAQIGVSVQLAQMSPPALSALQQAIGSTGVEWADTLINTLGDVGNALIARWNPMQTTGSTGGFSSGTYPIKITGIFHDIAEENLQEFGAPLCQTTQIRNLRGYVLCAHGDFDGAATRPEIEEINGYLTSGFFYE